ncbi:hypothetical protein CO174_05095 [Candidatus Uhrbacteria bacterium CG_4_9_14_3_um_filter_50_9]|uniref:Uncharacterized protein n=1 Tax=Candidatus Uhrbacteria bacterium CG_4_9_14_3_um_filter_50_9 TaxID=1975035 RepID=A0A2M7XB40_9BACT|nr:MAG: hypothetical protein CO174_05095 [Candidatus Uhrbacteria bacterium CG_4_9_14_3_um_filter_50_9]
MTTMNTVERQRALDVLEEKVNHAPRLQGHVSTAIQQQIADLVEAADLPTEVPWPVGCSFSSDGDIVTVRYPSWDVGVGSSYIIKVEELDGTQVPCQRGTVGTRLSLHPRVKTHAPIEWYTNLSQDGAIWAVASVDMSMPSGRVRDIFFDHPSLLPRVLGKIELHQLFPPELLPLVGGDALPMQYGTREEAQAARTRLQDVLENW